MLTLSTSDNKPAVMSGIGSFADKLSTNSYVDIDTVIVPFFRSKIFRFSAATNNLLVNVLGSIDGGVTWDAVESDISVTTATPVTKTYTTPYTCMKIQVKAASAGNQGTLSTKFFGSWL